jgi:hypothetical protein
LRQCLLKGICHLYWMQHSQLFFHFLLLLRLILVQVCLSCHTALAFIHLLSFSSILSSSSSRLSGAPVPITLLIYLVILLTLKAYLPSVISSLFRVLNLHLMAQALSWLIHAIFIMGSLHIAQFHSLILVLVKKTKHITRQPCNQAFSISKVCT